LVISTEGETVEDTSFCLCPNCFRAVPARSGERYCPNDGTRLLERCPLCETAITSPYAQFCVGCGFEFALLTMHHSKVASPLIRGIKRRLE
jgi:predicted amidophosphoribosyltransferase